MHKGKIMIWAWTEMVKVTKQPLLGVKQIKR